MSVTKQQNNIHLLWRAGFGPAASQLHDISRSSSHQVLHTLIKKSADKAIAYNVVDADLVAMLDNMMMPGKMDKGDMSAADKKTIREKNRDSIKRLNLYWLKDMVSSAAQMREKMSLFWHGHFACRSLNAVHQQALLNAVRANATGSFRDLLFAVSKSGAMLNFLNNNQNRKNHPNENFAREVMELFTLGRGHYTEQDIKEAARAFTGWGADGSGNFLLRERQHDDGVKTIFGKAGNFNGDDVLNMLLDQKQTASFITQKIYRFYVNEQIDETKIATLAEQFYKTGYDIAALMKSIFSADWFYEEKNKGAKIKSPVELLAGIQRILPMEIGQENGLLLLQRILGQLLLYPPNVAGWAGGKSWIDSSTLMMRMRIPRLLSDEDVLNVKPKDDDDQMMGKKDYEIDAPQIKKKNIAGTKSLNATIQWENYTSYFNKTGKEDLLAAISAILIPVKETVDNTLIKQYADVDNRQDFIKTATMRLMSLPEYQLC